MAQNELPGLSGKEMVIMNLLTSNRGEQYGLQLIEHSNGALKRGTIYVTLHRLEEKGYVKSRTEDAAPGIAQPRRLYKPTGLGARVFNAISGAGGKAWLREVMA